MTKIRMFGAIVIAVFFIACLSLNSEKASATVVSGNTNMVQGNVSKIDNIKGVMEIHGERYFFKGNSKVKKVLESISVSQDVEIFYKKEKGKNVIVAIQPPVKTDNENSTEGELR